jgi:hypothetical protein
LFSASPSPAAGYGGADPLLSKVPFFAVFGLVSAAFGIALGLVGHWLRWLCSLDRANRA